MLTRLLQSTVGAFVVIGFFTFVVRIIRASLLHESIAPLVPLSLDSYRESFLGATLHISLLILAMVVPLGVLNQLREQRSTRYVIASPWVARRSTSGFQTWDHVLFLEHVRQIIPIALFPGSGASVGSVLIRTIPSAERAALHLFLFRLRLSRRFEGVLILDMVRDFTGIARFLQTRIARLQPGSHTD